jgi:hypothetical protein
MGTLTFDPQTGVTTFAPSVGPDQTDAGARVTAGSKLATVIAVSGYTASLAFDDGTPSEPYAFKFEDLTAA